MNAAPPQLNPVQAVQPAAAKQQDAAADVPFSQVLNSEIAQNRHGTSDKASTQDKATGKSATPDKAAGKASSADQSGTDAAVTLIPGIVPDAGAVALDRADTPQLLPAAEADLAAIADTAILALAIPPDRMQAAAPLPDDAALDEQSPALATPFQADSRKGRSQQAQFASQTGVELAQGQLKDASQADKAATAAFSGQLASARQSDALKAAEAQTDFMAQPALRATPHPSIEAPHVVDSLASSKLAPSVGTTAWSQALGEKVVWMATGAQQSATLTLNPPNLGPLQVVLNVSNEQATASFFSAQPEVRQALEAAFPKLREMMDEAGIQLGQATVSADTPPQHQAAERQGGRNVTPFAGAGAAPTNDPQAMAVPAERSGRGLVDTFA